MRFNASLTNPRIEIQWYLNSSDFDLRYIGVYLPQGLNEMSAQVNEHIKFKVSFFGGGGV